MRAGVGISSAREPRVAAEEAVAGALAGGLRPDSALLFLGPGFGRELPEALDAAIGCLGTEAVVGVTAHGVLGCGHESEGTAAVAVLAQSGLEAHPFLISDLAGDEATAGAEIAAHLGGPPRSEDLIVLLPRCWRAFARTSNRRASWAPGPRTRRRILPSCGADGGASTAVLRGWCSGRPARLASA
jgi:small ligand-binding sensory domain FIST